MKKEKNRRWYFNKYLIAFILFAVWMVFFDTNSVINQVALQQKLNGLQEDTAYYRNKTDYYNHLTQTLSSDMEALEKIGRDEYRMKRNNEVVYIIQK